MVITEAARKMQRCHI